MEERNNTLREKLKQWKDVVNWRMLRKVGAREQLVSLVIPFRLSVGRKKLHPSSGPLMMGSSVLWSKGPEKWKSFRGV